MNVGAKIKKVRELRDYTQEYMAQALKISQSQYARIERDQAELNFSRLQQIAELLQIDPVQLILFDGNQYFNTVSHSQVQLVSGQYYDNRYLGDEERVLYEKHIAKLEEEVVYLRALVNRLSESV